MKRKLIAVRPQATQMGKTGEKRGLMEGSEIFPPRKAPTTKEKPMVAERSPKRLFFKCSFGLKSAMLAWQMAILLAKNPVMRRPRKSPLRKNIFMLHAVRTSPANVKKTLIIRAFFLPLRSAYSPIKGAPRNCPKENAIKKIAKIAALSSWETELGKRGVCVSRK